MFLIGTHFFILGDVFMSKKTFQNFKELTINQRITAIRKIKGYTQYDIAEFLGIKLSTYSQKERKGIIDCEFLKKISDLFEMDIRILLYGTDPNEITPVNTDNPSSFTDTKPFNLKKEEFILSNREKALIIILRNFPKPKRENVYKYVDELRKT